MLLDSMEFLYFELVEKIKIPSRSKNTSRRSLSRAKSRDSKYNFARVENFFQIPVAFVKMFRYRNFVS